MAFFTYKFVRAGEELCWNYSYEVRMENPLPPSPLWERVGAADTRNIICGAQTVLAPYPMWGHLGVLGVIRPETRFLLLSFALPSGFSVIRAEGGHSPRLQFQI
jgi:hypothetical protein